MHDRSFRVSVNHRTLTLTTGSVLYVRDHSYACVCTRGLGKPTANQHMFDSKKTHQLLLCSWRSSNSGHWCYRILGPDTLPVGPPSRSRYLQWRLLSGWLYFLSCCRRFLQKPKKATGWFLFNKIPNTITKYHFLWNRTKQMASFYFSQTEQRNEKGKKVKLRSSDCPT